MIDSIMQETEERNILYGKRYQRHALLQTQSKPRPHHRKSYKYSKGAIQFPYKDGIPMDLIKEIAEWCGENNN